MGTLRPDRRRRPGVLPATEVAALPTSVWFAARGRLTGAWGR
jgi:hypothetical protein